MQVRKNAFVMWGMVVVTLTSVAYVMAWVVLFKILGHTDKGYFAYRTGAYGRVELTESWFSYHGYDSIGRYSDALFAPLNDFVDSATFTQTGEFEIDFAELLRTGKLDPTASYYYTVRHRTLYVSRYSWLGYRPYFHQPLRH
ncbi:MAG TPA: hypothetical protein VHX44_13760 [Planctomycetota bacterium]|nr:hypothetical protein [Planctomycetota bacterium]